MCHFDVASGPFKCHFGTFMWPCGTLEKCSVVMWCDKLAGVTVNVHGAAEVPKSRLGSEQHPQELHGEGTLES